MLVKRESASRTSGVSSFTASRCSSALATADAAAFALATLLCASGFAAPAPGDCQPGGPCSAPLEVRAVVVTLFEIGEDEGDRPGEFPAAAFQLLRLIKAIADFDGMSFLLAFDPSYLENILATHGIANSSDYLEKVVQVRLSMPVTSYANLQQMADQELTSLSQRDLTSDFEGDADRLTKLYHYHIKNIVRTPRELKRVFNHLAFVLSEIEGEVTFPLK